MELTENGYYVNENGEYLHRIIAEWKMGRPLEEGEIVHHKNMDKLDNRPDNLEVMTKEAHDELHKKASKTEVRRFFEMLADKVRGLPDEDFDFAIEAFKRIFSHMKFSERQFRRYCGR